jgi:ankyrin repeat protein
VRLLTDHGANVNAASKRGRTALLVAAMSDHSAGIVKLLIEKGAALKAVDFLKTTPSASRNSRQRHRNDSRAD